MKSKSNLFSFALSVRKLSEWEWEKNEATKFMAASLHSVLSIPSRYMQIHKESERKNPSFKYFEICTRFKLKCAIKQKQQKSLFVSK